MRFEPRTSYQVSYKQELIMVLIWSVSRRPSCYHCGLFGGAGLFEPFPKEPESL